MDIEIIASLLNENGVNIFHSRYYEGQYLLFNRYAECGIISLSPNGIVYTCDWCKQRTEYNYSDPDFSDALITHVRSMSLTRCPDVVDGYSSKELHNLVLSPITKSDKSI